MWDTTSSFFERLPLILWYLVSVIQVGSKPFAWNPSNTIVLQIFLTIYYDQLHQMPLLNPGKHCKYIPASLMFLVFLNKDLLLLELYFCSSESQTYFIFIKKFGQSILHKSFKRFTQNR